jgi:hypothetical protein
MTPPKVNFGGGEADESIEQRLTLARVRRDLAAGIGWRGALASGNGRFRINGAYDEIATGRAARRMAARLERASKKRGRGG